VAAKAKIFEVQDYQGTPVVLGAQEWHAKIISAAPIGHPEVAEYLDDIRALIQDPDIVFASTQRSNTHLFYTLDAGRGEYKGKALVVVVKYVEEKDGLRGYISTTYLARGLYARGKIVWQKKNLIES